MRRRALGVRGAAERIGFGELDEGLAALGRDGPLARSLDAAADLRGRRLRSLSSLTTPLALDYLDRLARPIGALGPESGVQIVSRAYLAHCSVEDDPAAFGAPDVPVLGVLPPLRRGSPPRDLLSRVVKASRRDFELIRAVSAPVWEGFVLCLARRVHQPVEGGGDLLSLEVVDGLGRFGWVLRQVDIHYGLEPELG